MKLPKPTQLKTLASKLHLPQRFTKSKGLLFIVVFAVAGSILLFATRAAGPFVSLEPEQGSRTTNATISSDITASGGQFVQFGSKTISSLLTERTGVTSVYRFYGTLAEIRTKMQREKALGVHWIREDFDWQTIEGAGKGQFDWTVTDRMMEAAALEGMDYLPILGYSTGWSGRPPDFTANNFLTNFVDYAKAVTSRYGQNGSFWATKPGLPPRPITVVEVFNEPWGPWYFNNVTPSPAGYAALARAVAIGVHAAQPQIKVLATAQKDLGDGRGPWFSAVLDADPTLHQVINGWVVHPYPYLRNQPPTNQDSIPAVEASHNLAVARGADLPFWNTELGWSTQASEGPDHYVSEQQQADYHVAFLNWVKTKPWMERSFIYTHSNDDTGTGRESHYGLYRSDGSPKPAIQAVTEFLQAN